jgi:hypothetical protein
MEGVRYAGCDAIYLCHFDLSVFVLVKRSDHPMWHLAALRLVQNTIVV